MSEKGIGEARYAGAWSAPVADDTQSPDKKRKVIYKTRNGGANFQLHHRPFNYFSRFDPSTESGRRERSEHLKDYEDLISDAAYGQLPSVVLYKPHTFRNEAIKPPLGEQPDFPVWPPIAEHRTLPGRLATSRHSYRKPAPYARPCH